MLYNRATGTLKLTRTNVKLIEIGTDTNVSSDAEGTDGVVWELLAIDILDRDAPIRHALTDDVRPVALTLDLSATSQIYR